MPSATVRTMTYDEANGTLEIEFTSGAVYRYFDVPPEARDELESAFSKGQAFNAVIRDRYRYERITP